ncbi:MAG: hypothetical protein WC772_08740 [Candidatus Margulisiibacteriota bacterium]|jgi:hypothetical protein
MANRHRRSHEIELEFAFDRLHTTKLEQVFAILVPNRERRIDESPGLKGEHHENSRIYFKIHGKFKCHQNALTADQKV